MVARGRLDIEDLEFATGQFIEMILGQLAWIRILGEPAAPFSERCKRVVSEAVKMFLARYGV